MRCKITRTGQSGGPATVGHSTLETTQGPLQNVTDKGKSDRSFKLSTNYILVDPTALQTD